MKSVLSLAVSILSHIFISLIAYRSYRITALLSSSLSFISIQILTGAECNIEK